MADSRSPLAIARDDWFETKEGQGCSGGIAEGKFLKNRLEAAFLAGAKAQEKIDESKSSIVTSVRGILEKVEELKIALGEECAKCPGRVSLN